MNFSHLFSASNFVNYLDFVFHWLCNFFANVCPSTFEKQRKELPFQSEEIRLEWGLRLSGRRLVTHFF